MKHSSCIFLTSLKARGKLNPRSIEPGAVVFCFFRDEKKKTVKNRLWKDLAYNINIYL